MAGDIQYLMQAFTGIEDRLSKIEASAGDPGIDPNLGCPKLNYKFILWFERIEIKILLKWIH